MTPTLLIRAMSRTPAALIAVVAAISTQPRITALRALSDFTDGSPTSWNAGEIWGSVACGARATAASEITEPHR